MRYATTLVAMASLTVHPDRLLPTEPGVRDLARRLYAEASTPFEGLPDLSGGD